VESGPRPGEDRGKRVRGEFQGALPARMPLIASTDMWKNGRSRTSRSCSATLDLPELDVPLRKMTCPVRGAVELMAIIVAGDRRAEVRTSGNWLPGMIES
jgi:hypothetical protein